MTSNNSCELLGPFALLIQSFLGLLALSSLVWKRYHEYPNRRPWEVWFFDVSKQVFGAFGIHILNVFLSIISGKTNLSFLSISTGNGIGIEKKNPKEICDNPCDYYFLNILFDTTIGIPILWLSLYIVYNLAHKAGMKGIESGEYGSPPKYSYYFKQLGLYIIGLAFMKIIIYEMMEFFPLLVQIAVWVLSWSDKFPNVQMSFVLLIFPLIMNTFQYYMVDNIIQSPEYYQSNKRLRLHHVRLPDDDEETAESITGIRSDIETETDSGSSIETGLLGQHIHKSNRK